MHGQLMTELIHAGLRCHVYDTIDPINPAVKSSTHLYQGSTRCAGVTTCVSALKSCPGGTFENSPTLQRWGSLARLVKSRRDGRRTWVSIVPSGLVSASASPNAESASHYPHLLQPGISSARAQQETTRTVGLFIASTFFQRALGP